MAPVVIASTLREGCSFRYFSSFYRRIPFDISHISYMISLVDEIADMSLGDFSSYFYNTLTKRELELSISKDNLKGYYGTSKG